MPCRSKVPIVAIAQLGEHSTEVKSVIISKGPAFDPQ